MISFATAFALSMLLIPPLIKLINHFKLHDVPDLEKSTVFRSLPWAVLLFVFHWRLLVCCGLDFPAISLLFLSSSLSCALCHRHHG
jgi:UDP-N-acetylmuramyl pentapeptide phosphotransferase/UDP-N-acetylglucosamine-1-phosphate transferase